MIDYSEFSEVSENSEFFGYFCKKYRKNVVNIKIMKFSMLKKGRNV